MRRFKNILIVHSEQVGSDDALSCATDLAISNAARLTIADYVRDSDVSPLVMDERQKRLSRLVFSLQQTGIDTSAILLQGTPFLEIIRQVLREGHDLVVMVAESRDSLRHFFFGSTSMHLMRKCPCPVWVMKPNRPLYRRKILAAVDWPSVENDQDELNKTIMDFATSLARSEDSELHIVHAWDFNGNDADTMRSEVTDAIRGRLFDEYETEHKNRIDTLLERYDLTGIRYHVKLIRGRPESVITEKVEELDIDLIVMATVCRTGVPGFFIGNTAEHVLNQAQCSALVMKPTGFVTPIVLGP